MSRSNPEGITLETLMQNLPQGRDFSRLNARDREQFLVQNRNALAAFGVSRVDQLQDRINENQKGWFNEYVKGKGGWISFGTIGKLLTLKPVEGVVNALTFNKLPGIAKLARWAAVAASIYLGLDVLKQGATSAYEGGNILLDRMTPGAGRLTPPMEFSPAPAPLQDLPRRDVGRTA